MSSMATDSTWLWKKKKFIHSNRTKDIAFGRVRRRSVFSEYRQTENVNLFNSKRAWKHECAVRDEPDGEEEEWRSARRIPRIQKGRIEREKDERSRKGWKGAMRSQTKACGNFSNAALELSSFSWLLFFLFPIFLINYRYWLVPDLTS